jgi:hypothetical protein
MTRRLLLQAVLAVVGGLFSMRGRVEPEGGWKSLVRSDLADLIANLSPSETPFMSLRTPTTSAVAWYSVIQSPQ